MTVIEYCTEEVSRQGFDTNQLDGIRRVVWMLNAWKYAIVSCDPLQPGPTIIQSGPTLGFIKNLGQEVEPEKNRDGFRRVGVQVGGRICPPPEEIRSLLKQLVARWPMEPLEFYKEFELIHPFVDGNGRVGKVLLNTFNGTLLNPIFPPDDLWGEPIRNP